MRNKFLLSILFASLVISIFTLRGGHEWGDDFASYILQARSILNGNTQEFVEHNTFTILKSSFQIGPVAYPWGYPLILTPFYALNGVSSLSLKLPGVLFFACFLLCLYYGLIETNLTPVDRLLFVGIFAFNPGLIKFLNQILSDVPFLFFSTLALFLMLHKNKSTRAYVLLGVTISIAFFIRTAGILLLVSYLVIEFFGLWNNRKNIKLHKFVLSKNFMVCYIFGLLWIAYALIFPGGGESYLTQYSGFQIGEIWNFSISYFGLFGSFFGETTLWANLYHILFIFFLIGLWIRRREETIFIIFFFLWMVLLITWPYWQGLRFIFPLLPIFIYFTFQGMKTTISKLPERWHFIGQRAFVIFWLVILCTFFFDASANVYSNLKNAQVIKGPFDAYSIQMFDYIKEVTAPNSVIVFFKPRAMRLMTDRDAIMLVECDHLLMGDYVVLSRNQKIAENHQIQPDKIVACKLPLKEVFKNRNFVTYKILKWCRKQEALPKNL